MSRLSPRVVPAYAKLNLSLSVVARRPDGWHDIDSVLVPIDWHDLVGVTIGLADSERVSLTVNGPAAAGVPVDDSNLTVRAARTLGDLAERPLDICIWLCKTVPHGAGLGGGSADAAAVLRAGASALQTLGIAIASDRLASAALEVGSDIPALLRLEAQRVRGRGEDLERLSSAALHVVVVATVPSSTAAAYAALLPEEIADDGRAAALMDLIEAGRRPSPSLMGSALEAAACRATPALGAALERVRNATPTVAWHLTGSGGAVFTVTAGRGEADQLAAALRATGHQARAARTIG